MEFLLFFGTAGPYYPKSFEDAGTNSWQGIYQWLSHLTMRAAVTARTVRHRAEACNSLLELDEDEATGTAHEDPKHKGATKYATDDQGAKQQEYHKEASLCGSGLAHRMHQ